MDQDCRRIVTLETKLLILLHWATPACMKKKVPTKLILLMESLSP